MSSIIKQLSSDVIDKIAAGEVIERPASVVKELVENSIDAGASKVSVFVEKGGHQTICVVDDGFGMNANDLDQCYKRHATSKMSVPSDLFNITSLGFRGEALSSISAVSVMSIETRARGDKNGMKLEVEAGIVKYQGSVGHAEGSSVTVKNLFYNTPARRKFLKKVETESKHISRVIINLAAAYPNIAFVLEHNERQVMHLLKSTPRERAADLLGVAEGDLTWIDAEQEGIHIKCALCCDVSKIKGKGRQYIVVRKRPIFSRRMIDAIYNGCGNFLSEDAHPGFLFWLDLDPNKIDVNVHPTKKEIRIENEIEVAKFISDTVRGAIVPSDVKAFKINLAKESKLNQEDSARGKRLESIADSFNKPTYNDKDQTTFGTSLGESLTDIQNEFILEDKADDPQSRSDLEKEVSETVWTEKNIWQSYGSFILVPLRHGLLVIDQNAAHERVLYERAMKLNSVEEKYRQELLIPLVLKLSREDYEAAMIFTDALDEIGFSVKPFGELTLAIDSIPIGISHWEDGNLFRTIVNDLASENEAETLGDMREALARAFSKRACIAADIELKDEETRQIFKDLMACKDPFFTPDGVPVITRLVRSDLERLLGRL
ncbi:MAG: DNA mismatch repair endonuclease MutL [Candidatus Latescibacterota bacterium]|nr:DNA mismatch repair endonuclease MutL [Candidatus Latescibacterota bacterium]